MQSSTKNLLSRLRSLEEGDGLRRAHSIARTLWLLGLALTIFVGVGIAYGLPPGIIAIASAVLGWLIAESNALRARLAQWPVFRNYIDWQRVRDDLAGPSHDFL